MLKLIAAEINVAIHAVGILISLPSLLNEGEKVEKLSLGASNIGKAFDVQMDSRVAEFTFINWQGGSESARKKKIFKDFFFLPEANTDKQRFLYVIDDH